MTAISPLLVPQVLPSRGRGLNPEQQAAVDHRGSHLRIIAGAGTGKTATLAERCVSLIKSGVPAYRIMLLTFTNTAAATIRRRVETRCAVHGLGAGLIRGGTMHAMAYKLLRRHGHRIGMGDLAVIDRSDTETLLTNLRRELSLDLPQSVKSRQLAEALSHEANTYQSLQVALADHPVLAGHVPAVLRLQIAYADYKRDHDLLDYDDLLYRLIDLAAVPGWSADIEAIMVDEVQDLNALQVQVLRSLLQSDARLTVVGDPCQAIYGWRGALPSVMDAMFGAGGIVGEVRNVTLSANYRSGQRILDYAYRLISTCPDVPHVPLRGVGRRGEVTMSVYPSGRHEAQSVAAAIKSRLDAGIPASDLAVLYSSSVHGVALQCELASLGIPYVTKGGLRVADTAHVRDMLALLRLSSGDDHLSLCRVLSLIPGIGAAKSRQIASARLSLDSVQSAPPKSRARIEDLLVCWEAMRQAQPADAWAAAMAWYAPLVDPRHQAELDQVAASFRAARSVKHWLDRVVLDQGGVEEDDTGKVTLSTIHSVKGWEFVEVWLVGVAEGRLPKSPESQRLLYVACTRAKHALHISTPLFCSIANQYRYTVPSSLLPPIN